MEVKEYKISEDEAGEAVITTVKGKFSVGKSFEGMKDVDLKGRKAPAPLDLLQLNDDDFKFYKTVFKMHEYDGLDIVLTRDKIWAIASGIENGSEKRLIMFVIGIYIQVGTNWSDPKKAATMKKGARDLIKLVQRSFRLDTRLTDSNKKRCFDHWKVCICFSRVGRICLLFEGCKNCCFERGVVSWK